MKKLPEKVSEQIASTVIKNKRARSLEYGNSTEILLSQPVGRQMKINLGDKSSSTVPQISTENLSQISLNLDLSFNETKILSNTLRVVTKNRKILQPNSIEKLRDMNHSIDNLFSSTNCDMLHEKKKERSLSSKTIVFCNDIQGLVETVLEKRNKEISDVHLKFGMDGGGGFFKICLFVQTASGEELSLHKFSKRQKFSDGIASKKLKDTGVKKTLLLGLVEKTQENYENIFNLFSLMKIDVLSMNGTVATDLKLANICCGLMPHSSCFPCTWCTANKNDLDKCGELRTIGGIKNNFTLWQQNGGVKQKAKNFLNCINPPIFTPADDSVCILDIIPPPELHLLIGVVNTLYNHMIIEFESNSLAWAQKCSVKRDFVNGSPSFAGNPSKKLLDKVDILSELCDIGCLKFVQCYRDFKLVVDACFSDYLKEDYDIYISRFKESYIALHIPITPKVHAVFFHVPDFCAKVKRGLAFYSEQAVESLHSDFKSVWSKYKRSMDHPNYAGNLLRAVQEYNAKHL